MAARTTKLRAVAGNEKASQKKAPNVGQAAKSGDHLALLTAMRDRIAVAVTDPECPPRDLAALTRRLQEIAKEIEGITAEGSREDAGGAVADEAFDASAI